MAGNRAQLVRIAGRDRMQMNCRVDGKAVSSLTGDTVLTAVLTLMPHLRKFEFAEGYRAGFCLMGACQDCWVAMNDRPVRACLTLIVEDAVCPSSHNLGHFR